MDAVEVDPRLFVTCRLCLEDLGQYQIVPSVQQQIKYCFDIEVAQFDGLPQLICTKCKDILKNFHAIKKLFCEKQANLINRVVKKEEISTSIQPQQDTVSSSQAPEHINEPKQKKPKRKRTLSSDVESNKSFQSKSKKKKSVVPLNNNISMPWKVNYKRWLICKLCNNSFWPSGQSLANHIRSHNLLRKKYTNIFSRECTVKMNRIDSQPNITGLDNMVVYNNNRIIESGNLYSYTVYSKDIPTVNYSNSEFEPNIKEHIDSKESSDEDEIILKRASRKRRFISRSSSETVVIESNSNKVLSDFEDDSRVSTPNDNGGPSYHDQCINIDDSSDNESDSNLENSKNNKQPMEAKLGDYKIIQGIISMCINSYHKKNEPAEADMLGMNGSHSKKNETQTNTESQLKHKVLSIGRKIINKQGFNCTGLLRYMEHKNLDIVWIAKPQSSSSRDTNYIRILTKLREPKNKDENAGWIKISQTCEPKLVPTKSGTTGESNQYPVIDTSTSTGATSAVGSSTNLPEKVSNLTNFGELPATIRSIENKGCSDSKKLLNANPVANPKQLPKKLGPGNESRSNKTIAPPISSSVTNDDGNFCMPIITSTTSLAVVPNKDQEQSGHQTSTDVTAPRIKVKPASELMSERTLNSLMIEQAPPVTSDMLVNQIDVWPQQHQVNVYVPNMGPPLYVASPPLAMVQMPQNTGSSYQVMPSSTPSNGKDEYVILDSTDLPNTKTDSPFRYLKDLLQMHSLVLLDPTEVVSREFISIIKFKVLFKQDHQKDQPVMLCLSFLCLKNIFCLKFKDRNQQSLDINKISANWQWELLQIYRGDVSNKVLQNARKFGQETYDLTNNFLCLLKSIKCRKLQ